MEDAIYAEAKSMKQKASFVGDTDQYGDIDNGMCISMHQPWASLMVHGFKRFEGREWNHSYKGPLWVQSTSRKPTPVEIEELEN